MMPTALGSWLDSLVTRDDDPVWTGRARDAVQAARGRGMPDGMASALLAQAAESPLAARDVWFVADGWTAQGQGTRAGSVQAQEGGLAGAIMDAPKALPNLPQVPAWLPWVGGAVLLLLLAREARAWAR